MADSRSQRERLFDQFSGRFHVKPSWFQHDGQRKEGLVHEREFSTGLVRILDDRRAHGLRTRRLKDSEEYEQRSESYPASAVHSLLRNGSQVQRAGVRARRRRLAGEIELELEIDGPARLLVHARDGLAEQR